MAFLHMPTHGALSSLLPEAPHRRTKQGLWAQRSRNWSEKSQTLVLQVALPIITGKQGTVLKNCLFPDPRQEFWSSGLSGGPEISKFFFLILFLIKYYSHMQISAMLYLPHFTPDNELTGSTTTYIQQSHMQQQFQSCDFKQLLEYYPE